MRSLIVFAKIILRQPLIPLAGAFMIVLAWGAPWVLREKFAWSIPLLELPGSDRTLAAFWHSATLISLFLGLALGDSVRDEVDRPNSLLIPELRAQLIAILLALGPAVGLGLAAAAPSGYAFEQYLSLGTFSLFVFLHSASRYRVAHPRADTAFFWISLLFGLCPIPFFYAGSETPWVMTIFSLIAGGIVVRKEFSNMFWKRQSIMAVVGDVAETATMSASGKADKKWRLDGAGQRVWTHPTGDLSLAALLRAIRHEATTPPSRNIPVLILVIAFTSVAVKIFGNSSFLFVALMIGSLGSPLSPRMLPILSRDRRARLMFAAAIRRVARAMLIGVAIASIADLLVFIPTLSDSSTGSGALAMGLASFAGAPVGFWVHGIVSRRITQWRAPNLVFIYAMLGAIAMMTLSAPLAVWLDHLSATAGVVPAVATAAGCAFAVWGMFYLSLQQRLAHRDLAPNPN